jgi:LCP family protein required for cell wall assembly
MKNFDGLNNYAQNSNANRLNITLPKKRKRRIWKWLLTVILLLAALGIFFGSTIISKTNQIFTNQHNIFTRVGRLLVSEDKPLRGEENGRVNILLLGMGGPGHDGPYLTDTMVVASIDTNTNEISLVSIPRDYMVRLDGRGYNKVNAAYAYAEMDQERTGGQAAINAAAQITGLDIQYFAAIDFAGFVKAVDTVGGLDIAIERTFTDAQYPNYNNGYLPPQTFTKGPEHMDGERALIFARSRHGNNGEGSDFARSDRQKKIMLAFKDKVMGLNITDLGTLNQLLSDFTENFRTNMEPYELKRLAEIGSKINGDNVWSLSLDPQIDLICDAMVDLATGRPAPAPTPTPTPELDENGDPIESAAPVPTESQITRAYVVMPCSGFTQQDIHQFVTNAIKTAGLQKETPIIEVQNSTGATAALAPWRELQNQGFDVTITTNRTPVDRNVIYDNTKGAKPKTLEHLKSLGNFTVSDLPYTQSQADFVILLGNPSSQQ